MYKIVVLSVIFCYALAALLMLAFK